MLSSVRLRLAISTSHAGRLFQSLILPFACRLMLPLPVLKLIFWHLREVEVPVNCVSKNTASSKWRKIGSRQAMSDRVIFDCSILPEYCRLGSTNLPFSNR